MYVFLDTEFVLGPCVPPQLLSIGMCALDGSEFYRELPAGRVVEFADEFLRRHVLPQLGRDSGVAMTAEQAAHDLASWLDCVGHHIEVCYDYSLDYDLFEGLLRLGTGASSARLLPCHVGYLNEIGEWETVAEACFEDLASRRGLKRHHALADAIALRAKFVAAHCAR